MWLARASKELGSESDARAAWHGAVAACANPDDFTELEHTAGLFPGGGEEEKVEAWTAVTNRFPGQVGSLRALRADEWARGDLVAAQAASERLAALAPDDAALGADADLISLLRGCGTEQAGGRSATAGPDRALRPHGGRGCCLFPL